MNDFKRFIRAIEQNDEQQMNGIAPKVTRVITDFLRIHFNVDSTDAEDCAQNVLLMLITKTRTGEIDSSKPAAYIFVSARNEYFRLYRHNKKNGELPPEDILANPHADPGSLLIDSELKELLYYCIERLHVSYRRLVLYMLSNPDEKAEAIAKEFNTSANNIWIRKHRLNQKLLKCIKKNS